MKILSLWTSSPTKRNGLLLRLSVWFFTLGNRFRFGVGLPSGGSTRTCFRATRAFFTTGKRTFFSGAGGRVREGTQPSCLGEKDIGRSRSPSTGSARASRALSGALRAGG